MTHRTIFTILAAAMTGIAILGSCAVAKQVPYFQDILSDSTLAIIPEPVPIRFEPEDKISILVNSRDPQLMMLFNLPVIQRYIYRFPGAGQDSPGRQDKGRSGLIYKGAAGLQQSYKGPRGDYRVYEPDCIGTR